MQNQKAVTAYFSIKHLLPFGFAEQYTALQIQKAVIADLSSKQ